MKCFEHQDRDAVGVCKSCCKGVCSECAVDVGKGLACRDRCEDDARALTAVIDSNCQMVNAAPRQLRATYLASAALCITLGVGFLAWGLLSEPQHILLAVLGGA